MSCYPNGRSQKSVTSFHPLLMLVIHHFAPLRLILYSFSKESAKECARDSVNPRQCQPAIDDWWKRLACQHFFAVDWIDYRVVYDYLRYGAGDGDFAAVFGYFSRSVRLAVDILRARIAGSGLVSGLGPPRLRFTGPAPADPRERAPALSHHNGSSDTRRCNSFTHSDRISCPPKTFEIDLSGSASVLDLQLLTGVAALI